MIREVERPLQEECPALKWCLADGLIALFAAYTLMCFGCEWYTLADVFGFKTMVVVVPTTER